MPCYRMGGTVQPEIQVKYYKAPEQAKLVITVAITFSALYCWQIPAAADFYTGNSIVRIALVYNRIVKDAKVL